MDCSTCSICRTWPRISLVFAVVAASLVLQPMSVSSRNLKEQHCKPRPTVVPVKKDGFRPYHIELHRCSGTCDTSTPPTHRPCTASLTQAITLDLIDLATNKPSTVTVFNHTKCGCDCEVNCKDGEYPDDEKCICVGLPKVGERKDKKESTADVFPYQIGMAIVGFFALCVLVFDMILCAKNQGVLYKVKEKCCKSDQVDNKEGMATLQNGQCTSARKDNSSCQAV